MDRVFRAAYIPGGGAFGWLVPRAPTHPRVVPALALAWCAAFPLVGLPAQLHLFADGAIFSYAVAAGDAWEFHWRQIPVRAAAFLWASLPAQAWGRIFGDPAQAVALYGALHFLAPALGFAATWRADRTGLIRMWAALSIILLCPVVFGFPTELWTTHAAIWPALALFWSPGGRARWAAGTAALATVVLSHEGGLVWAGALLACLAFAPDRVNVLRRAALSLGLALTIWIAVRIAFPIAPYEAEVLTRNAWRLVTVSNLCSSLVLTAAAGLAAYCAALLLRRGPGVAFGVAAAGLAVWWVALDTTLHAGSRYELRALLLGLTPGLLALAALHACGRVERLAARARAAAPAAMGALLIVTLVHAVETAKFVAAWRGEVVALRALAADGQGDPTPGDGIFVSWSNMPARFAPLSWHSTTPFLAVMVSDGYAPRRLVVHPDGNYFWFGCAAATANAAMPSAFPHATREMIRDYTCLHH
jgi:hypothetical protein